MSKNKLMIIGAGGHGKVCLDIAIKMNKWDNILLLDDNNPTRSILGHSVVGKYEDLALHETDSDIFVAIGDNVSRRKICEDIIRKKLKLATLIHPDAIIGIDVVIGNGTVIMAGVVINSSTIIGDGCIVNTSCSIDHDCTLYDYVHISPCVCLAGNVKVNQGSWVGMGSKVVNNTTITANSFIRANSLVFNSRKEEKDENSILV